MNKIISIFFLLLISLSISAMESPKTQNELQRRTALGTAVRTNDLEAARKILQEGPLDVNFEEPIGVSFMHTPYTLKGIRRGQAQMREDFYGLTPLMWAALNDNMRMVELLLKAGARIDLKNPQGLTASDIAIATDHPNIAKLIEEKTTVKPLQELVHRAILKVEGGPEAIEQIKDVIPPLEKGRRGSNPC